MPPDNSKGALNHPKQTHLSPETCPFPITYMAYPHTQQLSFTPTSLPYLSHLTGHQDTVSLPPTCPPNLSPLSISGPMSQHRGNHLFPRPWQQPPPPVRIPLAVCYRMPNRDPSKWFVEYWFFHLPDLSTWAFSVPKSFQCSVHPFPHP